ncbi:MAG: UDP-2,3-diacylglucosamine diphosphatase LpxI [Candidatus Omnitrophota bacterium]
MEKIGIIAGNRKFPIIFSQAAKARGFSVVAVAIKGDTSRALKNSVDKIYWIGLSEFSKMFEIFKSEGISRVIMAGQISPRRLFSKEINRDPQLKEMLSAIKDKRADTIFGAIAVKLKNHGLELIDSTTFIGDFLPQKGTLTRTQPEPQTRDDISFGFEIARHIGSLDIGQTVAVKHKAIVAVEALEGTDNLIRRAGRLARGGITVVKVSKPKQDVRFDIPVVGLNTVKNLISAGASCLAIEAGKTLFIDKEEAVKLADKKGISIVAV